MSSFGSIWDTITNLLHQNTFNKHFENGANPSFDTLLNDDNIISEFKNQGTQLMKYMKLEHYEQLVSFITQMPNDENNKERAFKFPFIACELLTADISQIYDFFLDHKEEDDSDLNDDYLMNRSSLNQNGESDVPQGRLSVAKKNNRKDMVGNLDNENDNDIDVEEDLTSQQKFELMEKKMSMLFNFDKFYKEFQEVKQKLKKEEEISTKYYLQIQNLKEQLEEYATIHQKQADKIVDLKSQLKSKTNEINELKASNSPTNENTLVPSKKEGKYLLALLCQFLNTNAPVNQTLAGYVSKVLIALINKKETEIVEFIFSRQNLVDNILKQLSSKSIGEILLRLLTFESNTISNNFVTERTSILNQLSTLINTKETDMEERQNCTYILGETLRKWQTINSGSQIIEFVLLNMSNKIVEGMISEEDSVVYNNAVLLNIIFQLLQTQRQKVENQESEDLQEDEKEKQLDSTLLVSALEDKISEVLDYLLNQPTTTINTSYKQPLKPLGTTKLKIIEWISLVFQFEDAVLITEMAQKNVFAILLELFKTYEWNNVLHNRIEKIISQALESKSTTAKKALFEEGKFISELKECSQDLYSTSSPQRNKSAFRKGYLGHVAKLGNILIKMKANDKEISDFIDKDAESWKVFTEEFMAVQNEKDEKQLGGHSLNDGSDSKTPDVSFNQDEIYNKYKDFLETNSDASSNKNQDDDQDFEEEIAKDDEDKDNNEKAEDGEEDSEKDKSVKYNNYLAEGNDYYDNDKEEDAKNEWDNDNWEQADDNTAEKKEEENNNFDEFGSFENADDKKEKKDEEQEQEQEKKEEGEEKEEKEEEQNNNKEEKEGEEEEIKQEDIKVEEKDDNQDDIQKVEESDIPKVEEQ